MNTKVCTKCGTEKPSTSEFFQPQKECRLGLRPDCKECTSIRNKEAYRRNPEPAKERARKRRENKREELRAYDRAYYIENKFEILDRAGKWAKENPIKRAAITRTSRAKRRRVSGVHTEQDILRILSAQRGKCFYCGIDLEGVYHVDHMTPLCRGGSNWPENLCCACGPCNLRKNRRTAEEYLEVLHGSL